MTYRLVGLMSLVLLISLAAFAFLMNSYQEGVMEEVNRTVSAVGKATLQTFEVPGGEATLTLSRSSTGGVPASSPAGPKATTSALCFSACGSGGDMKREAYTYEFRQTTRSEGGKAPPAGPPSMPAPDGSGKIVGLREERPASSSVEGTLTPDQKIMVVRIEDVRAESDPVLGTVLKIPTQSVDGKKPPAAGEGVGQMAWVQAVGTAAGPAPPGGKAKGLHEIVLPIPTHDFQKLFADYRKRTLLLFLGIFVVGTLLSAGLAARFTRPVRRLDAGIRRLTEGDLDARVEARGRDEIGRLARGFNEMTRRLRVGRDRERDLRRREKLSSLGRLAAGVAHDVRNPLHSIGLTLQNLEETARPGEDRRAREFDRSVGIIREEIRRLDRLVENFLRFARSDRSARVSVDLAALARDTAQLVEREALRRGIRIEVTARGDGPVVVGNVESLRSSVLNLVLNSFEAMPEGGAVVLTAEGAGDEARLEVADNGRGIPEQDQEKVFDFAYTTREDGHGMGLAMVHQVVVEDHGGRVSLQSRPGEGTRVLLAFPREGRGAPGDLPEARPARDEGETAAPEGPAPPGISAPPSGTGKA